MRICHTEENMLQILVKGRDLSVPAEAVLLPDVSQ